MKKMRSRWKRIKPNENPTVSRAPRQWLRNPFAEEDAQTDPIFKDHCISSMFHPTWDKVYGDSHEPSTAVVFGEKGSGKTAMRLQIASHLQRFNREHPQQRIFVIHYEDFNPFLDRFSAKVRSRQRRPDRALRTGNYGITWMRS